MRTLSKKLLLLLSALPSVVQAQFNYTTNNGTITITKYTGPGGAVTIPSMITGLSVTSIGDAAFMSCTSLTNVTIPDSVTSIGGVAFGDCYSLANVTLPGSVINIGIRAFNNCWSLTNIRIPDSVTSIGVGAFGFCTCLSVITVDALNPNYSSFGGVLFDKGQTTLIQCPGGKTGSYTIPNSVTSIGDYAFCDCPSLTGVSVPNRVISLGNYAFEDCTSLTSVSLPNSVTSIGNGAFWQCSGLTSVTIPKGVTSIGKGAFYACASLTGVTIPNSVTSIGEEAFSFCDSLTSVMIPNSVSGIEGWTFDYCTSLVNVTIPNSVTYLGANAFDHCTALTSVTIPDSVTSIGSGALMQCHSLTNITIPNSVTNIGDYVFYGCISLTTVTIGNSVTNIGEEAFYVCASLTAVYFLGNAPSLGSPVFVGDNNVTVYYLPGTTGWGSTYGGRPTALWIQVPTIRTAPQNQTAEAGSAVGLRVKASSPLPLFYFWYLNATNLLSYGTNWLVQLTNVQFSQAGAYTVVISNVLGAITSAPAMLQVIAPVQRRPVPGLKVSGAAGSLLNVDYADSLSPAPIWTPLGSVSLASTSQYHFDLTLPLPARRFYRAWQTGTPGVIPSLELHLVPAITLTGNIGHSVRVDYINQVGPIDAWVTLATVTLTNAPQLCFDVSASGHPQRLYRLVP